MSPEERELLNRAVVLAEENNKILHSMRRSMYWSRIMSVVYWVIILGISFGAYYFIQPYFNKIISAYNSVFSTEQKLTGNNSGINVEGLLNNLKK